AGIGTISPPVTVHGILAPGVEGPGVLSLTGNNLSLGSGSQSFFESAGTDPLSQFDRVVGIGTLTLDGTITINLTSGFSPMVGDQFNVFDAGAIAAQSFNVSTDLSLPALGVGLTWKTDSFTNQ